MGHIVGNQHKKTEKMISKCTSIVFKSWAQSEGKQW